MTSSAVSLAATAALAAALSAWSAGLAVRIRGRERLIARVRAPASPPPSAGGLRRSVARLFAGPRARVACALGSAVVGLGIGGPPLGLCGALAGFAIPTVVARVRQRKLMEAVEGELAEATSSIAAALRSGLSLRQAIEFASTECGPPVSEMLAAVVERESLGVPLDASLERWASDAAIADVRLVSSVLQLHHRVGGESPAVLDQAARTVRLRRAAAREVRSLTAQARLSGAILGLLPVGFFAFMSIVSRHDVRAAYSSAAGLASIVAGLLLDAGAFLWIRSLLRVEA